MAYYVIVRSHYYGSKSGPWRLVVEGSGELMTFASRKEANATVNSYSLSHNEYACEFQILSDANYSCGLLQRRVNSRSSGRRTLPEN